MYLPEAIPVPWRILRWIEKVRFAARGRRAELDLPLADGCLDAGRVRLLALGDLALLNVPSDNPVAVFGDLMPHFERADLRTLNLEAQLSNAPEPDWISGHALRASPATLPILARAGIDVVNVANNHALDLGPAGLDESASSLASVGIDACGLRRGAAVQIVVRTVNGIRIGFLGGCDDHEPAPAPGPEHESFETPLPCTDEMVAGNVASRRREVDFLVVHLHWGYEFSLYPLADHQARARNLVDLGADLVLCHHAHVPQGIEKYGRGVIAYGLGNAWMPMVPYLADGHPWTDRSFALEAECTANGVAAVRLIPYEIREGGALTVLHGKAGRSLLIDIARISNRLRDGELLLRLEVMRVVYELERTIAALHEAVQGSDPALLRRTRKLALPRQQRLLARAREIPGCRPFATLVKDLASKVEPDAIRSAWRSNEAMVADARRALLRAYRWRDAVLARTP